MITCQKCGKENQDHYKFCLGCGAELSRRAAIAAQPAAVTGGVEGISPAGASKDAGLIQASAATGAAHAGVAPEASVVTNGTREASFGAALGPQEVVPGMVAPRGVDATHASPGVAPPSQESDDGDEHNADGSSVSVVPVKSRSADDAAVERGSTPSDGWDDEPAAAEPVASPAPEAAVPDAAAHPADAGGATCPQCGRANDDGNRFCASCGYKLDLASLPARSPGPAPIGGTGQAELSLTALRADGTEAGSYALQPGPSETVGRDTGSIFSGDSYLSPRHATFARKGDRVYVSDAGSLNGVYLKISPNAPWPLRFGDVFRIGQEILRLEKLETPSPSPDGVRRLGSPADGYVARLGLVIGRDTTGNAFPVPRAGLHLGRERGDILFPEDGYVSGLHCRLAVAADGSISLTDLGSSNGSFVRLKDEHPVSAGDILLMGQQLFRVNC